MITGYIKGQNLELRSPLVVADTIDYLTAQFVFQTVDWEGCRLFSHWKCGETNYTIELSDAGKIEKEQHLNLTAGTWTVWIHGERYRDGELIQRITTDEATLAVTATGTAGGSPFPEVPASDLERINAEIAELQDKVGSGGGAASGDAMRLLARVEVPYEGTPPIIDMIDFSRKYTFLDIAEAYVAGRTITLNTEHDLVPYQYGMFWLDHLSSHGIEFHGHYRRVKDVEADVEEGWVPAVAFLREDGTLTVQDREWSGYAKQTEVDSLSKAIADKTGGSKIYYAICDTPGETNPKMAYTVTKDFVLETGARVGVWFKYNNIGSQNLSVDETGAFQWISARKADGSIVSDTPTMYKAGGQTHWFTFDGEYWVVDDSIRAGEDTVGKVTLAEIRTQAAKNHYTKTEVDNKFSALDTALAEAIGSGVVS